MQIPAPLNRRRFLAAGAAVAVTPLLWRVPGAGAGAGAGAGSNALLAADGVFEPSDPNAFGFPQPDMTSVITKDITFPHEGDRNWTDTYGACRDGCSRRHEGQDLLGSKLRKLIACVDGTIVELRHRSDGNSLYLQGEDGWYYAYLHINNDAPGTNDGSNPFHWAFAPGMANGVRVHRGQHIAYMGDSGNAESTVAHCHFEIRKPADVVWNAQAINARYSLDASRPPPPSVTPDAYTPWNDAEAFVRQQYVDVLNRQPEPAALSTFVDTLQSGAQAPPWLTQYLVGSDECQDRNGAVLRMYQAFFARKADYDGYRYWLSQLRGGVSISSMAGRLAASTEFTRRYGGLRNRDFVANVYLNVLRRAPDANGSAYWTDQLDHGLISRGRLMLLFSESNENRDRLAGPVNVTIVHTAMLRRMPTQDSIDSWYWRVSLPGASLATMIDTLRRSSEYGSRFD